MGKAKIILNVGDKFGRLTITEFKGSIKGHLVWSCKCECGRQLTIRGSALKSGHTLSCGCFGHEQRTIHGFSRTRLFKCWDGMMRRVNYENGRAYKNYGGRGIKVCDEWSDFLTFREWALSNGYSDSLTLDRIDVNGHYQPSNCRWITMKEQQNNRRSNHYITYQGRTQTLMQWSEEIGIDHKLLSDRITSRGWSTDRALNTPKLTKWDRYPKNSQ